MQASVDADTIDRSGIGGPVTLEARLTPGGDPVRGAQGNFKFT
jgi:hypothetical protein